ncbi:MAG TPA: hypothetical protein VGN26_05340 [Armatimonadota bacterium]
MEKDSKQQLMADALWAVIERMREDPQPRVAGLDGLTAEDAGELADLFLTAASLRAALESVPMPAGAGSEARVQAAIAERLGAAPAPPSAPQAQPSRRRWSLGGLPRLHLSPVLVAATCLLVGVVMGSRLPLLAPLERPPAGIAALSHGQALAAAALLAKGQQSTGDLRSVLWHLANCGDCRSSYEDMLAAQGRSARVIATPGWTWASAVTEGLAPSEVGRRGQLAPGRSPTMGWRPGVRPVRGTQPPIRHLLRARRISG